MSTAHTIMWQCPECPWREPVSDHSLQECGCGHPLEPVYDEQTISIILRGYHALMHRAEMFSEILSGSYLDDISFEGCEDIEGSFQIESESRTCGCCPGEPHYEFIPLRSIIDPDFLLRAKEKKKEREEKQRQERAVAALRTKREKEARERTMLKNLQAKYGSAG